MGTSSRARSDLFQYQENYDPRATGSDALDYFLHVARQMKHVPVAPRPRLLGGDRDPFFDGCRIVRANLRSDAILQWSHDLATRRVILGVGAEN